MIEKVIQFFKTTVGKITLLAFLLGMLFGWLAIGWWLWPVNWVDAGFVDLQEGYRTIAMENAIYAYAYTGDAEAAIQSYSAFGSKAASTYSAVKDSQKIDAGLIANFDVLLQGSGNLPITDEVVGEVNEEETETVEELVVAEEESELAEPEEQPVPENEALSRIGTFLGVLFVLFLLVGVVLIYIFIVPESAKKNLQAMFARSKMQDDGGASDEIDDTPAYLATMGSNDDYSYSVDVEPAAYQDEAFSQEPIAATTREPRRSPIERTVNYVHNDAGHSHLDQNFSLKDNDDSGKTVLEYGIAMSDYVEIAGVTYALAFDVYLASHPERRTITRVLVNKELLNHPEVLQRYEGKGEPIKIDDFHTFQLQTAKYQLNGTILSANYVYDENYGGNYLREMEVDILIHYL